MPIRVYTGVNIFVGNKWKCVYYSLLMYAFLPSDQIYIDRPADFLITVTSNTSQTSLAFRGEDVYNQDRKQ